VKQNVKKTSENVYSPIKKSCKNLTYLKSSVDDFERLMTSKKFSIHELIVNSSASNR